MNGLKSREITSKIKTLSELTAVTREARRRGLKVAHCHGVFDLLHPGHIIHFREARRLGDLLVATVTPDRWVNKGPGRPLFSERLRLESLAALEMIDYVALNDGPAAVKAIKLLRPHFYVKGSDYADPGADPTGKIADEAAAARSIGGRLAITGGFSSSSSRLINRFFSAYPPETRRYLERLRGLLPAGRIIAKLKELSKLRVLVVGESIIDEYAYSVPLGKSPKETVVSARFLSEERFAGGAAATARHLAGFCGEVALLSALGPDSKDRRFFESKLPSNVEARFIVSPERPTVRKRRFLDPVFLTRMFEVQRLDDRPLPPAAEKALGSALKRELSRCDLVVINDFGHGLITPRLRESLGRCRKFTALDAQSNSANHGYNPVTNYARADYVAIDEPELRLAARDKYGDVPELAARVRRRLHAKQFLVSRGAGGCFMLSPQGASESPALAPSVVDRLGAGDALFAVTSPCAFMRMPPEELCFVANCVGALAVAIVGNREPVRPEALYRFIDSLLK